MSRIPETPAHQPLEIVRWGASLGAITAEALAVRLDLTVGSARQRLVAGMSRGHFEIHRPLAGRPSLYTVTRSGLRACGGHDIAPVHVSPAGAHHAIVCAAIAAELGRRYPDQRVIGEPELHRDERTHGSPLASAPLQGFTRRGVHHVHRPDLVLWPVPQTDRLPVAVEVELTVKGQLRLCEICRAWARSRLVAGVVYFAAPEAKHALARALAGTPGRERIAVFGLEGLPSARIQAAGLPYTRPFGSPREVQVTLADGRRTCRETTQAPPSFRAGQVAPGRFTHQPKGSRNVLYRCQPRGRDRSSDT